METPELEAKAIDQTNGHREVEDDHSLALKTKSGSKRKFYPAPLFFGPYHAPALKIGDWVRCELRGGPVQVFDFSGGRLPWPRAKVLNNPGIIVCGDLVEALKRESNRAIQLEWGVSSTNVSLWRRAVGAPRITEGTKAQGEVPSVKAARDLARMLNNTPENCQKHAEMWRAENRISPRRRNWTPQEDALLGKFPEPFVAKEIGITGGQVRSRRLQLGIPAYVCPETWEEYQAMCELQGGEVYVVPGRWLWTAEQDALLGQVSDTEIARRYGCSHQQVACRRYKLKIPPCPEAAALNGSQNSASLKGRGLEGNADEMGTGVMLAFRLPVDAVRLRERRMAKGLRIIDVHRLAGYSRNHYRDMETGFQPTANRTTLERFAQIFECELTDLMPPPEQVGPDLD